MVDIALIAASVLRNAAGIVLGVLGETVSERSGVLNLGLDGVMLVGALAGIAVSIATGSAELGIIVGGLAGAAFALIYALLVNALKLDQIVAGIGVYMLGVAVTTMLGKPYAGVPPPEPLTLFGLEVMVLVAYLLPLAMHIALRVTGFDVKLRMVGDDPLAADMAGIDVSLVRSVTVVLNGFFAGMGGALYVMLVAGRWRALATGGIGWLALALTPVTLWKPILSYIPGLVYSTALMIKSLSLGWLPSELRESTPYIAVLVVAAIVFRLVRGYTPRSLGRVYIHGGS